MIFLTTVLNAIVFPRLGRHPTSAEISLVSVLIPARNEAAIIAAAVRRALAQTYPRLELIILDDHSQDGTAEVALTAGGGDPRLHVLPGEPLPAGWLGKNWACQQLAQAAKGDYLLFIDADVELAAGAVAALMGEMEATRADMLTVWPTQRTVTWAERLTAPLMAFAILGYLPLPLVHHTPWRAFAAANGQCLLFRRRAYQQVGAHAAVRGEIVEDVMLARRIKGAGLRLRMADGAGLIACRMYDGWRAVREGYGKNILAGYGGRVSVLLLATLFHWLTFLWPWVWLAVGWSGGSLRLAVVAVGAHRPRHRRPSALGSRHAAAPGRRPVDAGLRCVDVDYRRPGRMVAVALRRSSLERTDTGTRMNTMSLSSRAPIYTICIHLFSYSSDRL